MFGVLQNGHPIASDSTDVSVLRCKYQRSRAIRVPDELGGLSFGSVGSGPGRVLQSFLFVNSMGLQFEKKSCLYENNFPG